MLGSAVPAAASLHTSTSSATPTSPTRPSRLRGLSYLRNYTLNLRSDSPANSPPADRFAACPASPVTAIRSPSALSPAEGSRQPSEAESLSESTIHNGEYFRIPIVQGRSGLSRRSLRPAISSEEAIPEPMHHPAEMTRGAAAHMTSMSSSAPRSARQRDDRLELAQHNDENAVPNPTSSLPSRLPREPLPSIRFIPHVESRSNRPSLSFTALSRTLQEPASIVRVGRYSERDTVAPSANTSSSTPVGFKSKVVSRRHCEFWCSGGQWYVKDVKSSSGTFLNHVRLSSPGAESRPYPVNDGDIVQLGIDFKGGEEIIFRCVKIRIECNRGWQKSLNSFNTSAHQRLLKNTKLRDTSDAASTHSSECSICLNAVAPCQALFVAPCSHVWHYKCIRDLLHGPHYPMFLCPNCRLVADLDADVEQPESEGYEQDFDVSEEEGQANDEKLKELMEGASLDDQGQDNATSRRRSDDLHLVRSTTPTSRAQFALAAGVMPMNEVDRDGPMTPRNEAGPFVLDGDGDGVNAPSQ